MLQNFFRGDSVDMLMLIEAYQNLDISVLIFVQVNTSLHVVYLIALRVYFNFSRYQLL